MSEKTEKELLEEILKELKQQNKFNTNIGENFIIPQLRMMRRIQNWLIFLGVISILGALLSIIGF